MKIRQFIKIASRAEKLVQRVPSELISAIKRLTAKDIYKLLHQFLPLDFVALVQKENKREFEGAFRRLLSSQFNAPKLKTWIEEVGITADDAVGNAYINMLNDDPKNRGILNDLLLYGSQSDEFQFARKDEKELRLLLKQNLSPISSSNGMVVPHCPTDKSLNIEFPLWNIDIIDGEVEILNGFDTDGQCVNRELLGEMSEQEFNQIKETLQGLTQKQIDLIKQGKRELEYKNGAGFLRCTFKSNLPKFSSFVFPRSMQSIKNTVDRVRKELGKTIPAHVLKRRTELRLKENDKTITPEEKQELSKLEAYFQKKSKEMIHQTSLDFTMEGNEGEGKSRHETISIDDTEKKDLEESRFELSNALDERQFEVLSEFSQKVQLGGVLSILKQLMDLPRNDPSRSQLTKQVKHQMNDLVIKYLGQDNKTENTCKTCDNKLSTTAESCTYSAQMRSIVFTAYDASDSLNSFKEQINKLDQMALIHYTKSNIESLVQKGFSGSEVGEDEISLDLDLSGFESFKEENLTPAEKTNLNIFKDQINKSLSSDQQKAFYGTDINNNLEVQEVDVDKINLISDYIEKILYKVFEKELEQELATYLLGYGAE